MRVIEVDRAKAKARQARAKARAQCYQELARIQQELDETRRKLAKTLRKLAKVSKRHSQMKHAYQRDRRSRSWLNDQLDALHRNKEREERLEWGEYTPGRMYAQFHPGGITVQFDSPGRDDSPRKRPRTESQSISSTAREASSARRKLDL